MKITVTSTEICKQAGVSEQELKRFIESEWILPEAVSKFDDEDLARVMFIQELQHDLGANDEAIPIILHLVDQLHYFQNKIRSFDDQS